MRKTILVLLGGSVLAVTTFVAGMVSATGILSPRKDPLRVVSSGVADIWTNQPVKVDGSPPGLQRVPAETASVSVEPAPAFQSASLPSDPTGRPVVEPPVGAANPPQPQLTAEHQQWCSNRYRSYRADDNSYTSFSGERRQCKSPYDVNLQTAGIVSGDFGGVRQVSSQAGQQVADLGSSAVSDQHAQTCSMRYRSYRLEDNTYQPVSGGPRRQCQ